MSERSIRRNRQRRAEHEEQRKARRGAKLTAGVGAALGATALFAPAAQADTLEVTNLTHENDGGTTPCTDTPGDCSLNEATVEANQNGEADVITFASGLTGTIEIDDDLEIFDEALEIQGPGANVITVDAQGIDQVFYAYSFDEPGTPLTISGLTVTGGSEDEGAGVESIPGSDEAADLTLAGLVVTGNYASGSGGGVFVDGGSLTITDSIISNNEADSGDGGGVFVIGTDGDQSIEGTTMTGNAAGGEGGGAYVEDVDGDITVRGSTFAGNEAGNDGGGAHLYDSSGDLLISDTNFTDNVSDGYGGGATLYNSANATIEGTTFAGNSAPEGGGGGVAFWAHRESAVIRNSTFSGNTAEAKGGGAYLYSDSVYDEPRTFHNSTVVGNTAGDNGGGFYLEIHDYTGGDEDHLDLSSTIVANNTAGGEGPDVSTLDDESIIVAGFSLIENAAGIDTLTESPAGSNLFGVDPQLGALANNGGPTQTHLPAPTSPAVDAGIANGLSADQRGLARTADLSVVPNAAGSDATDIGATELQVADCQGVSALKLAGTEGDDTLTGSDGPDSISGLGGNDAADGGGANDCVSGDAGADNVSGGSGKDQVSGGAGKDRASGGGGKDRVKGQAGKDNLKGGGGKDRLAGAGGKDKLSGGGGKDRLKGGPGKDKLTGGGGKDRFNCGGGKDKVTAQPKDKVSASCEKVVEKG